MKLTDIVKKMEEMLMDLAADLKKAFEKGNKAASQRVRTGTIAFGKLAKLYRKESITAPASKKNQKKPSAPEKKGAHGKKGGVKREKIG